MFLRPALRLRPAPLVRAWAAIPSRSASSMRAAPAHEPIVLADSAQLAELMAMVQTLEANGFQAVGRNSRIPKKVGPHPYAASPHV